MPEWLLKKDEYIPQKDNQSYINKSVSSIMGMISRMRKNSRVCDDKFNVNSVMKILWVILVILLTATTRSVQFMYFAATLMLVLICVLEREQIIYILSTVMIAALFTSVILAPSMFMGNVNNSLFIITRVAISVSAVSTVSATTKWIDITGALKVLLVPDIFILVFDIALKYMLILGEFAIDMLHALKLRSVGRNMGKNSSLSAIMGTIFIKSREMAEDMYGAMECRGFTGEYALHHKKRFKSGDIFFIGIGVIMITFYIYFR